MVVILYKNGDKGHLKHGLRHTRLYNIWSNIKTRCYNKNDPHFSRWGNRGITMCDEWKNDFKSFCDWAMLHGYSDELTIDRIDNNGNYEPSNCRWVSVKEQNNNKRNVIKITYDGLTLSATEWSKVLHLGKDTVRQRYRRGWTPKECIEGKRVVK